MISKIAPVEAYNNMKKDNTIILLDVRTTDEYYSEHIPNSINLPLDNIYTVEKLYPDKNQTIYIHCHSGMRSAHACTLLNTLGYKNVYDLGGIIDWPFEVVTN